MLENNDYSPNLIIEYLDNDRIRIAEELHDNTIQNLVHIIQKIEVSQKYLEKDTKKVHVELDNVISYAKETIQELREIIYNIKPMSLSDFNFTQTIQQLKEELEIVNKNKLNITYDIQYIENIEETYVLTIYRVIKECCVNAIKHSLGENIIVELKEIGDIIRISIMDDGLGINESKTKDAIEFRDRKSVV